MHSTKVAHFSGRTLFLAIKYVFYKNNIKIQYIKEGFLTYYIYVNLQPNPHLYPQVILCRLEDLLCARTDAFAVEIVQQSVAGGERNEFTGLPTQHPDEAYAVVGEGGETTAVFQLRFVGIDARRVAVGEKD